MPAPHPGEILQLEFLEPLGIAPGQLANALDIEVPEVERVIKGEAALTAPMALRLARYFGNSVEFWLGIQQAYDIFQARQVTDLAAVRPLDRRTA